MRKLLNASAAMLMIAMMITVVLPVNAAMPVQDPAHPGYPQTYWSDLGRHGIVSGRVTNATGTGIGGVYIAIVNASNFSQEYFNTTSDVNGYYTIAGVNATYSSKYGTGPDNTTGTYSQGTNMYVVYGNKTPYGEGYSYSFGVNADVKDTINTAVIFLPRPVRIGLVAERPYVYSNGTDNVKVTAHAYDVMGNPVGDGYGINFTVGNATDNAFTASGYRWSANSGSLEAPGERDAVDQYTGNNTGSASVQFGWVPAVAAGNSSTVWAYCADYPSVSASIPITFKPAAQGAIHVPGDYPTIQEAVDAVQPGTTVFVDSGTYRENVVVDKSLILEGLDTGRGLPVVDGHGGTSISLMANGVSLQGFKTTNATFGIYVYLNNCSIYDNIASNNSVGISVDGSYNNVMRNVANDNSLNGIDVATPMPGGLQSNNVEGNTANANGQYGIRLAGCPNSSVRNNTANNNDADGIVILRGSSVTVAENTANNNSNEGICILYNNWGTAVCN